MMVNQYWLELTIHQEIKLVRTSTLGVNQKEGCPKK